LLKFNIILNAFAAMVYIGIGIFVLSGWVKFPMKAIYLNAFGVLLTIYGLFRAYRFYIKFIKNDDNEKV
jgi:hypothetical protein